MSTDHHQQLGSHTPQHAQAGYSSTFTFPAQSQSHPNAEVDQLEDDSVPAAAPSAAPGTSENPLIPKRRRRTSPAELALLEEEFRTNPLPTQAERARLAGRVSMTGRALQVWFQNRRQKEKKEQASYQGGTVSSTGSAPDQDANTSDAGDFTFSSSPTAAPSSSLYIPLPKLGSDTSASLDTIPFLRPSLEIYGSSATPIANKRSSLPDATNNVHKLPSLLPPVPFPTPSFDIKPSFRSGAPQQQQQQQHQPNQHHAAQQQNMAFVHRPSGTSIIAAKKHVKKRPLGSHAPLARTPALPHAFDFPASPPKGASVGRPSLKRKGSSGSIASTASNGTCASTSGRSTTLTNEGGRARVWVDSLAAGGGPEALDAIDHVHDAASRRASLQTRDEVWQHMQSDLPSPSNSPAPLTRKMMRALAAESSGLDALALAGSEDQHNTLPRMLSPPSFGIAAHSSSSSSSTTAPTKRFAAVGLDTKPSLTRKLSLARGAEGSRAGGEETCAFSAFERKRARMTDNIPGGLATPTSSSSSASSRRPTPSRTRSTPSLSLPGGGPNLSRTASSTYVLPSASASTSTPTSRATLTAAAAAAALTASRPCASRRFSSSLARGRTASATIISTPPAPKQVIPTSDSLSDGDAPFEADIDDECDSSMGDLSFGSSSTANTTSSSGSYSAPRATKVQQLAGAVVGKSGKNPVDEERECAELLLGLGGFF